MKYPKHTQGSECQGCNERLKKAHPLIDSFFHQVKEIFHDVHCSWVFRDEESQNEAFNSGASKLKFPNSKHNLDPSEAIDLFQINSKGIAVFDPQTCVKIKAKAKELGFNLRWGGDFKTLGDYGHFELIT